MDGTMAPVKRSDELRIWQQAKEFVRFLYVAKGPAYELHSHLLIAKELKLLNEKVYNEIVSLITEVCHGIGAFSNYFKNSKYSGEKLKNEVN